MTDSVSSERAARRLLGPDEVAAHLGVSTRAVIDMLRQGRLAGLKVANKWKVRPEDLAAFVAASLARCRPRPAHRPLPTTDAPRRRRTEPELDLPGAGHFLKK